MTKAFITGIEGFVGFHLTEELLASGYDVAGLYYHSAETKHLAGFPIELEPGNITDRNALWNTLDNVEPDCIVHLAAITFVPDSHKDPIATWQVNLMGSINMLEWVRQKKPDTKMLIVSTGEVYGAPKTAKKLPYNEDSCFNPLNVYASTKAAADMAAKQYNTIWELPVIVARPFNHIGPGQSEKFVASAFAKQVAEIARGEKEPVIYVGNLSAARDFTDVRDVVRAYRLLLERVNSGIYNICSGEPVKIQHILDSLIAIAGIDVKVEIDPKRLRPVDVPTIYGDYEKLSRATGWQPEIKIAQSLGDIYLEYFRL